MIDGKSDRHDEQQLAKGFTLQANRLEHERYKDNLKYDGRESHEVLRAKKPAGSSFPVDTLVALTTIILPYLSRFLQLPEWGISEILTIHGARAEQLLLKACIVPMSYFRHNSLQPDHLLQDGTATPGDGLTINYQN